MPDYQPPFQLTADILQQVADLSEQVGRLAVLAEGFTPQLRRGNRIRTIQASLAIEHNTLTVEQVTAMLDGKRVLGLPREIQEVRNAFAVYEQLDQLQPASADSLLAAHRQLLQALTAALAQALQSTPAGSEKGSEKIPDRICTLLQRDPRASAKALAADLGISDRAVEKHLAKLKAEGRLKRVGPAKGGYWEVL
jgi:Fic family protein